VKKKGIEKAKLRQPYTNQKATRCAGGLSPSKNEFFDGVTTFCLSPFGLPGGKTHGEIAQTGRSVASDQPTQPEIMG